MGWVKINLQLIMIADTVQLMFILIMKTQKFSVIVTEYSQLLILN